MYPCNVSNKELCDYGHAVQCNRAKKETNEQ
jgi:hypothetical protein